MKYLNFFIFLSQWKIDILMLNGEQEKMYLLLCIRHRLKIVIWRCIKC